MPKYILSSDFNPILYIKSSRHTEENIAHRKAKTMLCKRTDIMGNVCQTTSLCSQKDLNNLTSMNVFLLFLLLKGKGGLSVGNMTRKEENYTITFKQLRHKLLCIFQHLASSKTLVITLLKCLDYEIVLKQSIL